MRKGNSIQKPVPFKEWGVYRKFKQMLDADVAGQVSSLRFTWQLPRDMKASHEDFAYGVLGGMIEITESLGSGLLESVHVEVAGGGDILLGIARLDNRVVAEFELNQSLPLEAEHLCYLQVDCERGRLTNRPLVGHQSCDGSMLVTDDSRQMVGFHCLPHGDSNLVEPRIKNQLEQVLKGQQ